MGTLLAWLEYLPRGLRRAWCDLTGGHRMHPLFARQRLQHTHVAFYCDRCHWRTGWHDLRGDLFLHKDTPTNA